MLGSLSRWPSRDWASRSYEAIIKEAFRPEWWTPTGSSGRRRRHDDRDPEEGGWADEEQYSLMEYNFSLFFGLAVQLYEATLVADDTPYDRFMEGEEPCHPRPSKASPSSCARRRYVLPDGTRQAAGRCINCHSGPEFTDAAVANILAQGETRNREGQDLDRGWNNIGVRPTRRTSASAVGPVRPAAGA